MLEFVFINKCKNLTKYIFASSDWSTIFKSILIFVQVSHVLQLDQSVTCVFKFYSTINNNITCHLSVTWKLCVCVIIIFHTTTWNTVKYPTMVDVLFFLPQITLRIQVDRWTQNTIKVRWWNQSPWMRRKT